MSEGRIKADTKNKEGVTPLLLCVDCEFSLATLKSLVEEHGCSVNDHDDQGRTALHFACDLENEEIITFLLENGADPLAQDLQKSTPMTESEFVKEWVYSHQSAAV